MTPAAERRLLQAALCVAVAVPLVTAGIGIVRGAAWLTPGEVPADLDSHFRYLSGIFLALGIAFASCIPGIERNGGRFRLLGAMVVAGGLARLVSALSIGLPSAGHAAGLVMELGVVPLLMLWQARVARRS
ncbi:DUF4345 domain-containing protein [Stakelama tenebrarum]|uniref:DUF4345 domain-containing protein n=1 Tax=Stakelama tenebrarum TaxID=2711215 RepID=A0A6G6Y213_9SPHN|nr:DUF4345 domain-containing protein [Sphingosinithalassobacter tenebrarum]QIG78984.1 DUF4345 domain-containing protein [Sphingosinithalassobacter tenebrarum]